MGFIYKTTFGMVVIINILPELNHCQTICFYLIFCSKFININYYFGHMDSELVYIISIFSRGTAIHGSLALLIALNIDYFTLYIALLLTCLQTPQTVCIRFPLFPLNR